MKLSKRNKYEVFESGVGDSLIQKFLTSKKEKKEKKEGVRIRYPSVNSNGITHTTTNSTVIKAIIFKTLVSLNFVTVYDCNSTNEFSQEKKFLQIIIQRLK